MFDILSSRIETNNMMKESMKSFKNYNQGFEPNAFYMAVVTNTNDTYKLGRVQIRIPAVHGVNSKQAYFVEDSNLPWARPAIWNCAGNDMGTYLVPPKGTRVFVTFEYNDEDKPIYFGGVPTLFAEGHPKSYNDNPVINLGNEYLTYSDDRPTDLDSTTSAKHILFKSIKGATIIIDDEDTKESIKIIDSAGQSITMINESNLVLDRRGNNENPKANASIYIKSSGTVSIECASLNIKANNTNLKDYIN